jgi:hypothetical protein
MKNATADRLHVKHPENTLHRRLCEELGICSAQADNAVEIFLDWAKLNFASTRPPGQIVRTAVAADEPAGKPIRDCHTREISLTIDHRGDTDIQHRHGTPALRMTKILRMSWEAYEQGALFSYEDLAAIVGVDRSTIKRLVKRLTELGFMVPTRGVIHDMGRAPSHKEPIGRLLCRGYVYTEIATMTGHTERCIERYALQLGQVIKLRDEGAAPNDIRIVTDLSEQTVALYLRLYDEHNTDEFRAHLDTLKRRFESGKGIVGPGQYPPKKTQRDPLEKIREDDFFRATSLLLRKHLGLTASIADYMAEHINKLHDDLFVDASRLQPGQTMILVDSANSAPKYSGHLSVDRQLVPVVLSPWTSDKIDIWRSERTRTEKLGLIADALAREAREQNGTMTVALLAFLLKVSPHMMSQALAHLRQKQRDPTPIKGHTEDAGTTTTHKNIICDLHDQGYTPPEISRITCHIPESRDRYLKTNLRVETLFRVLRRIPDEVQTARFLGIERSVARQYLQRLERNMALGDKTKPAAQGAEKPSASSPQLSGR